MAGKPPKVKPVPDPNKTSDSSTVGSYRPPSPLPLKPQLPLSHHLESLQPFNRATVPSTLIPSIDVKVSPMFSVIDGIGVPHAAPSLADYWIPTPKNLSEADARGIRTFRQRQYVAVDDVHFVQVALDTESGLFRATLAREFNPSGPLLKPDSEGRLWHPLDNSDSRDHVARLNSVRGRTAELFRSMGHPVDDFFDVTIARILAVSGMSEALARDPRMYPWSLDLLHDTVRRFSLDQTIRTRFTHIQHPDLLVRAQIDPQLQALVRLREGDPLARNARRDQVALFRDHEHAFELDCDENTLQMRRVFPDLPKALAQALWRDASAADRLHMYHKWGMPRQMAKDALVALRDFRLARACEGLYLDSVSSLDSDRLALHMIVRLSKWPQNVRIEIRQGWGAADIGDFGTALHHVLIRQDAGYVIHSPEGLSSMGQGDLYSTVWWLLLPEQRQTLGVTDGEGQALQHLIRAQPLPSRQAVSEALGLASLPVSVDPAAVQYRQAGGLRGGGDNNPMLAKSVADRVRELYPELSDGEQTAFINDRLKSDPGGVLTRLEKEFETLRQDLKVWCADAVPPPGEGLQWGGEAWVDQQQLRQKFSENLQAIWQRNPIAAFDSDGESFSAFIDFNGELPHIAARFEYVTELVLEARNPYVNLGRLLDSFPNVRYLILEKVRMEEFAPGIFQMRNLRHLVLRDCSLRLSDNDVQGLARIETLTLLRLDENPLGAVPHLGFMRQLEEVYLSDTGLVRIPSGVEQLESLKLLDLHDNNIVDVGEELFEIPDTQNLFVNLIDNPLGESARFRINEYLQNASMDCKIVIRTREPVFDDVSDLSESSDSGVESESD
ncbi:MULTISPECIES: leucine-rich repeat domain-containing protein [unclassified Pseudomonas]|uniref:leucine-rich repeat domain-containing protein n=1 Tax=unclassified Pseudomonas TaxID=196821 RepID=UPI00117A4D02|nr:MULTISPECIES: leucine-rich repeat domain-containing protein [unclassified Pseudomonas]